MATSPCPVDGHGGPYLKATHASTHGVHPTGIFVTQGEWKVKWHHPLIEVMQQVKVGMARASTANTHHHLTGSGFRLVNLP
jgi:hypothetical protein